MVRTLFPVRRPRGAPAGPVAPGRVDTGAGMKAEPPKTCIRLSPREALEAVCTDFRAYDPQVPLFCEVVRLISGGRAIVRREAPKGGLWIRWEGEPRMRWLEEGELAAHLCRRLEAARLSEALLATVCSRVFRERAAVEWDPRGGRPAIRIETGMEGYRCRQCGRCCRALDYRDGLSERDVEGWRRSGRGDILEWVGVFRTADRRRAYRMWVVPGTRRLAGRCPFLVNDSSRNRWLCRIHEVKPEICRQYPVSRKHALMTGCRGFEKE